MLVARFWVMPHVPLAVHMYRASCKLAEQCQD